MAENIFNLNFLVQIQIRPSHHCLSRELLTELVNQLLRALHVNHKPSLKLHCNPVQGNTGFYREIPVMKTGSLQ